MRDGVRRVQLPLLALAAIALAALPYLRHARNRLLSGQPVTLAAAAAAAVTPALALAASLFLLLAPSLRPGSVRARWAGLLGAGLSLACCLWLAAGAAEQLAARSNSLSARTSLGAGCWVLIAIILLLASDTARRLGLSAWRGLAAFVLVVGPVVALLAAGALDPLSLLREYAVQRGPFQAALQRHVLLVAGALAPALLIGLPLGVAAQRRASVRRVAMPALNLIQTIPSIALFGLLIGPLSALSAGVPALRELGISGVGPAPAILALVLYALLPIVRNTLEGLDAVPLGVREAARGMGMGPLQRLAMVELPIAVPVIMAGVRIAVVINIGITAIATYIGAGGLGAFISRGISQTDSRQLVTGALAVSLLAIAADYGLLWLQRRLTPRGLRAARPVVWRHARRTPA